MADELKLTFPVAYNVNEDDFASPRRMVDNRSSRTIHATHRTPDLQRRRSLRLHLRIRPSRSHVHRRSPRRHKITRATELASLMGF